MNLQKMMSVFFIFSLSFSIYGKEPEYKAPSIEFDSEIVNHNEKINNPSEYKSQWTEEVSREIASEKKGWSASQYTIQPHENYQWKRNSKESVVPSSNQAEQEILNIDYDGRNPASVPIPVEHEVRYWHLIK